MASLATPESAAASDAAAASMLAASAATAASVAGSITVPSAFWSFVRVRTLTSSWAMLYDDPP